MKTLENNRILTESTPFTSYQFGIRSEDLSHIFSVLRNQMYSDKILAVIREYSTNAYDAHVVAGIKNTPIRISLPNTLFPEFKVRDYGHGLSEEDVKNVYAWYGCSTKRNDNDTVGQLGFGSKSAFAYGDNFVITSYHGGKKTVYNAVIDPSKKGKISKLHEEDMAPTDKTGVEITVPVKSCDFNQFATKARAFYVHWDVRPSVAGYEDKSFCYDIKSVLESNDWKIFEDHNNMANTRLFALMGNVTYPISFSIINENSSKSNDPNVQTNNNLLSQFLGRNYNSLLIKFNIGDLEISSSRESLQYSEHTLKNIYSRISNVIDHIKKTILDTFEKEKTIWDAKIRYNEFFEVYGSKFYGFENRIGTIRSQGVDITNSLFRDVERWCNINGLISDDTYKKLINSKTPVANDPVLTTYTHSTRSGIGWRVKQANWHSSSDVVARKNTMLVINDIDKSSLTTKCMSKLIEKYNQTVSTVYMLKFTSNAFYTSFINHYNLGNLNIPRLSEVFEEVKAENKRVRKPKSELTRVKVDSLSTRNRKYTLETEAEIDLATTNGCYVPLFDGEINHNDKIYTLSSLTEALEELNKHFFVSFPVSGSPVYGFNRRVIESKSFQANKANWRNLVEEAINVVNTLKTNEYYEYLGYKNFLNQCEYGLEAKSAKELYNLLDNKNTKIAKFLNTASKYQNGNYSIISNISSNLNLGEPTNKFYDLSKKFDDDYKEAISNYELFIHIGFVRGWRYNGNYFMSEMTVLANYINSIDKNNKAV